MDKILRRLNRILDLMSQQESYVNLFNLHTEYLRGEIYILKAELKEDQDKLQIDEMIDSK